MSGIIEMKREPEWDVEALKELFNDVGQVGNICCMELGLPDLQQCRYDSCDYQNTGSAVNSAPYEYYRPRRLKCEYCGCISGKEYGTCEHCGAPLVEDN